MLVAGWVGLRCFLLLDENLSSGENDNNFMRGFVLWWRDMFKCLGVKDLNWDNKDLTVLFTKLFLALNLYYFYLLNLLVYNKLIYLPIYRLQSIKKYIPCSKNIK